MFSQLVESFNDPKTKKNPNNRTTGHLISYHQFGFRKQYGPMEQIYRVVSKTIDGLEGKRYCTAANGHIQIQP